MAWNCDSRTRVTVLSLILLCLTFTNHYDLVPLAEALWLNIPSSGTKCVSEEIQNNVVVLAGYYVINQEHPEYNTTVSVRVTSPYGNNLHHIENVTHGNFAFTTAEAGNYVACFWVDSHQEQATDVTLSLEWKIGIFAKDWDSVARKEKIEGVELNIRRLKEHVEAIHSNLVYLKHREAEMREVSETTNGRVAWFSIMSLGVCIVVSVLQLWYLKSYFQRKKLI